MKNPLPIALVVVVLSACGIESPAPVDPGTDPQQQEPQVQNHQQQQDLTGFPCEVREVLQAACAGCHAKAVYFGSFTTRAHLVPLATTANERLTSTTAPMPPYGAMRQLSAAEVQVLSSWFAGGAPAGTCGALTP